MSAVTVAQATVDEAVARHTENMRQARSASTPLGRTGVLSRSAGQECACPEHPNGTALGTVAACQADRPWPIYTRCS